MTVVVTLARLALALVWVVSAVGKLRDREGFREAVLAFGVPSGLVGITVTVLPIAELLWAALLILPGLAASAGALGSIAMLVILTAAIIWNLRAGRRPDCHCFGALGQSSGISWLTVLRNVLLMGLAGVALTGFGRQRSVPGALADLTPAQMWIVTASTIVGATLVAMSLVIRTLMTRYGTVLLRLEAVEQAIGITEAPLAPAFSLPDLDGETVSLESVLAQGRSSMLVFTSPGCTHCGELMPDLSTWQSDPDHPVSIVVLSDGTVEANRAKLEGVGPLRVLLRDDSAPMGAHEVQGTPAAVLVNVDGRRAAGPVHGIEGVRALHEALVRTLSPAAPPAHGQHLHSIGARPVALGDSLPDITLRTEDDREISALEAAGDEAVLLFWRFDCGFCQQIVDDVRALEASAPVRLVSASDLRALRDTGLTSPVLRDPEQRLESWLGVPGTPSAVRVRHGRIDSDVVVGGPDVLGLVRASDRAATTQE